MTRRNSASGKFCNSAGSRRFSGRAVMGSWGLILMGVLSKMFAAEVATTTQAIGGTKAGQNSKIHVVVDEECRPSAFLG
jgi:hypothetical protein